MPRHRRLIVYAMSTDHPGNPSWLSGVCFLRCFSNCSVALSRTLMSTAERFQNTCRNGETASSTAGNQAGSPLVFDSLIGYDNEWRIVVETDSTDDCGGIAPILIGRVLVCLSRDGCRKERMGRRGLFCRKNRQGMYHLKRKEEEDRKPKDTSIRSLHQRTSSQSCLWTPQRRDSLENDGMEASRNPQ